MYKRTYELIVGIFFLVGIATLAFMALKVSGLSVLNWRGGTYSITAQFGDIGSLHSGAAVRIAGVQVGTVKNITLKSGGYNGFIAIVSMRLNKRYNKIPADSSASIQTSGILGDSFVALGPPRIPAAVLGSGAQDKLSYLHDGSTISQESTISAMNLNSLVSTFASKSGSK